MNTTVLLIRHGETDWNSATRLQGQLDIPLNETGLAQARALANRLASWPITALYSSDLQRAVQTAALIGEQTGLPVQTRRAWRERAFGAFEGLTAADITAHYPTHAAQMDAGTVAPPGGEDDQELSSRAAQAFADLVHAHPGQMLAVVAHGGTLSKVVAHVLGLQPDAYHRVHVRGNTSLCVVESDGRVHSLLRLNDTAHLEPWAAPLAAHF